MESNEKMLKFAIQHNYRLLSESLDAEEITADLFSKHVLSVQETEHLGCIRQNQGRTAQAKLLIEFILQKSENQIKSFFEVVYIEQPYIDKAVADTLKAIKSGEISLHEEPALDVKRLKQHLKSVYKDSNNKWRKLEPIPSLEKEQNIVIDLDDAAVMMTPVFKAEEINTQTKDKKVRVMPTSSLKEKYTSLEKENLDELFDILIEDKRHDKLEIQRQNVSKKLILMKGIAGIGKTTICQQLAWQWANDQSTHLKKYDLVFVIPVRDVKHASIIDILAEDIINDKDIGLVYHDQKKSLHTYLNDPSSAKNVLMIIDGADEQDLSEELQSLIQGTVYPGCSVLATCRHDAKSLQTMNELTPLIKVELQGTDEESIHRFISETLKECDPSDIDILYQNCKHHFADFSLLFVPLYLTLLCFVFKEMFTAGENVSDFQVPKTMTALFNSFLNVIVRRWLLRQKRTNSVRFKSNPLGKDSTIPADIKRIIFFIANMCYNSVCYNKYEFNMKDLNEYFLTLEDITDCGLFCTNVNDNNVTAFVKHKQVQEYLAGLYLSYHGNKVPPCAELFHGTENKSLAEVASTSNLLKAFQFACGLSTSFCQYIFEKATQCCIITKYLSGSIDIYYEAGLLAENNTSECNEFCLKYLLSAKTAENEGFMQNYFSSDRDSDDSDEGEGNNSEDVKDQNISINLGNFTYYQKALSLVTSALSSDTAIDLVKKLYNLSITFTNGKYKICHCRVEESVSKNISKIFSKSKHGRDKGCYTGISLHVNMDQLLLELLSQFVFPDLTQLKIYNANYDGYLDLERALLIFPSLHALDATGIYFHDSDQCHSAGKVMGQSLQSVHIVAESNISSKQVNILQGQSKLQSVNLALTNILHLFAELNITPQWKYLKELKIIEGGTSNELNSSRLPILKQLLDSVADCLQILSLSLAFEDGLDITGLTDIISTMKHLRRLGVYFTPRHYTHHTLKCLANCNSIEHLVLLREDIEDYEEEVVPLLCQFSSIKTLDVVDINNSSYSIAAEYVKRLKKKNIKINYVKYDRTYRNNLDDFARLCFEQL